MGRPDGIRVKNEVPMYYLIPQFMTERHDAMNMVTVDIPVEPLRQYMNAKRREGVHISHMALVMTAYAHLAAEFPSLNRFIVNRRIYQHTDFKISLVVLRPGASANENTMSKLSLTGEDTVLDVQRKIDEYVEKNTAVGEDAATGLDKIMKVFVNLGPLMNFVGWLLRFGDRHGLLPQALLDVSPFHASALMTNLASIRHGQHARHGKAGQGRHAGSDPHHPPGRGHGRAHRLRPLLRPGLRPAKGDAGQPRVPGAARRHLQPHKIIRKSFRWHRPFRAVFFSIGAPGRKTG